jgi:hypothetical protein
LGEQLKPKKKIIIYSTFSDNIFFHNRKLYIDDSGLKNGASSLFPLCIPINNQKGFNLQIDSIYIKGSNIASSDIFIMFQLYKENKLIASKAAKGDFCRKKKINTFVFENGFKVPQGRSYLSFNYQYRGSAFDFFVMTNTKIHGTSYFYNKDRDEFKLTHTDDYVPISTPQVKIFCSILK